MHFPVLAYTPSIRPPFFDSGPEFATHAVVWKPQAAEAKRNFLCWHTPHLSDYHSLPAFLSLPHTLLSESLRLQRPNATSFVGTHLIYQTTILCQRSWICHTHGCQRAGGRWHHKFLCWHTPMVGQNHIDTRCIYGIFGREITRRTVAHMAYEADPTYTPSIQTTML